MRGILLVIAVFLGAMLFAVPEQSARAAVPSLPAYGNFYTDKSTIDSNAGPNEDPFHDLANDCNYNYPLAAPLPGLDLVNYLSILPDGTMYGECIYTDHYSNVTEVQSGSFTGTLNTTTGTFSATVINTRKYTVASDPPRTQTFSITLDIANGQLNAPSIRGNASFQFHYSCSGSCQTDPPVSYSGTIDYVLGTQPATSTDLGIHHIEVVQVVQDVDNTVPLVAGKTGVVRVFPTANAIVNDAKVKLSIGGSEFDEATLTVGAGVPGRTDGSSSANFILPADRAAGDVTFAAEILPPNGMSDTNEDNDEKSVSVTFEDRRPLIVDYIKVCHQPPGAGQPNCPHGDVNNVDGFARDIFPIADGELIYQRIVTPVWIYTGPLATMENEIAFLAALRKRYDFMGSPPGVTPSFADQVLAWLPDGLTIEGGAADPRWDTIGGRGRVFYLQKKQGLDDLSLGIAFAHEIAHNLGRRHPDVAGGCGAFDDDNTDWPYPDGMTHEVGFWVSQTLVTPDTWNDLMTYCDNRWISDHNYRRLFEANSTARAAVSGQGGATNYVIASGAVAAGGTSGSLDPAYQLVTSGTPPTSNPDGNTCLEFSGSSGGLGEFCFDLSFVGGDQEAPLSEESFSLKVPLPAGTARIALLYGDTELDALEASASAPSIEITSPAQNSTLTGQSSLTWTGSDSDGGDITYTVLYSPDGGNTWLPIDVDTTASSYSFDASELQASSDGMFRVLASDGLNTTTETLGPVTVGTPFAWGDVDCSGAVNPVDGLKLLRFDAGLNVDAPDECTGIGEDIQFGGETRLQGDVDCSGSVNPVDGLKILRFDGGLDVDKAPGCPTLGEF